jgi:hypothetical protein
MALFGSSDNPASSNASALAGAQSIGGVQAFTGGQALLGRATPGQDDLTARLASIAPNTFSGGTNLIGTAAHIEESGTLSPSGQAVVDTNLNNELAQIRGRYASLGLSGSSAEEDAINTARNRSLANQFGIAQTVGQNVGQLGQVLASAGQNLWQLDASTLSSIAQEGLSSMSIGGNLVGAAANTYTNLAQQAISEDANMLNTFQGFFKALAGNQGLAGMMGGGSRVAGGSNLFGAGAPGTVGAGADWVNPDAMVGPTADMALMFA